jgi:hypothetical protein
LQALVKLALALFHHSLQSIFWNPYSERLYARINVSGFVWEIKVQIPNSVWVLDFGFDFSLSKVMEERYTKSALCTPFWLQWTISPPHPLWEGIRGLLKRIWY